MAVEQLGRQPQQAADGTDFILEQAFNRLHEFEFHILRKPAHVVVAFDDSGGIAVQRNTFENVRINRSLSKERRVDLCGGFREYVNELFADDLALLFRVLNALELVEETVGSVNVTEVHVKISGKHFLHHFGLVLAEESMIDEYAGQLFADRLVDQCGNNGRVNSAGKTENDFFVADLPADVAHSLFHELLHRPGTGTAALLHAEIDSVFHLLQRIGMLLCRQFEHGQTKSGELFQFPVMGGYIRISADDQSDRLLLHEPLRAHGVRHDHRVDVTVTDRACYLLNIVTDEIQQHDSFRCLFHSCLPKLKHG